MTTAFSELDPVSIPSDATLAAPVPRSRRALLAGALGGLAGLIGAKLGGPDAAAASAGSALYLGQANDSGTAQTTLTNAGLGAAFTLKSSNPSTGATGIFGWTSQTGTNATRGVYGKADGANSDGIQGRHSGPAGSGAAVRAIGGNNDGVVATSDVGSGVKGTSYGIGVYGEGENYGKGVVGSSTNGTGVLCTTNGATRSNAALQAVNSNTTDGMAAYLHNDSGFATVDVRNNGAGQVLWLVNGGTDTAGTGGGDFINCRNKAETDVQFRVATDGTAYSDTSFNGGGADFAELLPATGSVAPGDVLAIGLDGRLVRTATARSRTVVGVYSTKPGFVAGASIAGDDSSGKVPLAVVGVVPVKASAENGPIAPGDRLVSASEPGHAMRSDDAPEVGSVIGKAIGGLAAGRGEISMLVMLQ
ncbi:MAG: hypothetical protein ABI598_06855 [Chloroflexota bacterium]